MKTFDLATSPAISPDFYTGSLPQGLSGQFRRTSRVANRTLIIVRMTQSCIGINILYYSQIEICLHECKEFSNSSWQTKIRRYIAILKTKILTREGGSISFGILDLSRFCPYSRQRRVEATRYSFQTPKSPFISVPKTSNFPAPSAHLGAYLVFFSYKA